MLIKVSELSYLFSNINNKITFQWGKVSRGGHAGGTFLLKSKVICLRVNCPRVKLAFLLNQTTEKFQKMSLKSRGNLS